MKLHIFTKITAMLAVLWIASALSIAQAAPTKKPTLSATQQQNILKLKNDLLAIKAGSQVTTNEVQALVKDIETIATGANKPSQASVKKLATDLCNDIADGNLTKAEKAQLAKDLNTVLNSANVSVAELDQAVADAETILIASGVTVSDVQEIEADITAIVYTALENAQGN